MENKGLFKIEITKSVHEFIENFKKNAEQLNFGVRYIFDMKKEYKEHNVDVDENFELYSNAISLQNSGVSLYCRLERSD